MTHFDILGGFKNVYNFSRINGRNERFLDTPQRSQQKEEEKSELETVLRTVKIEK